MVNRTGEQLGHYQLVRRIGHGGYADVYLGKHVYLPRQAALKILTASMNAEQGKQFLAEAQTLATLHHPHIIHLLDFAIEEEQELAYLVMEYASKGSVRTLYPHGTMVPLETVISIVNQVADALQYAHEQGIIHRDIKPENMLVGANDKILLSDFGISVIEETQTTSMLKNGDAAGTPTYMAPEQVLGQPRRASDQYALAVVAYEWLTGKPPFSGSGISLAMQHVHNEVPPLAERAPNLPIEVCQVIMHALSKTPEARYASVRAFADALQQAAQTQNGASATPVLSPAIGTDHTISSPDQQSSGNAVVLNHTVTTAQTSTFHGSPTIRVTQPSTTQPQSLTGKRIFMPKRGVLFTLLSFLLLILVVGLIVQLPITINALQANGHATATAQTQATATAGPPATATAAVQAYEQGTRNGVHFGFDMRHSGYNPYEHVLSPTNVGGLSQQWNFPTGDMVSSSTTVANGVVYVGSDDHQLYAINATTGKQLWSFSTQDKVSSSPLVANDIVYIGSSDKNLYALNASTGKQVWVASTGGGIISTPTLDGNIVYIGSLDSKIYAFDAQSGKELWNFPTGFVVSCSPAVVNGIVYVGSWDKNVYALDGHSGQQLWKFQTENIIHSSPAVNDGVVYIGSLDHQLYALDAQSGEQRWTFTADDSIISSPAVANGMVYIGSSDKHLYALDAHSGTQRWNFLTGDAVNSSPFVANGVVYVGSNDKDLYALDAHTGTRLWNTPTGAAIAATPAVANGHVYISSQDKSVYAFGLP